MPFSHVIVEGESVVQLSERYGLFCVTIWNDAANDDLRALRSDMNALLPGDVVVIPDKVPKTMAAATGKRHVFRRKGIPPRLRVRFLKGGVPRAAQEYVLSVDGREVKGVTDADGVMDQYVPASAALARVTIGPDRLIVDFRLGFLHPANTLSGARQRLQNLGRLPSGADDAATRAALAQLQADGGLEATGELDAATIARLESLHDARGGGA